MFQGIDGRDIMNICKCVSLPSPVRVQVQE